MGASRHNRSRVPAVRCSHCVSMRQTERSFLLASGSQCELHGEEIGDPRSESDSGTDSLRRVWCQGLFRLEHTHTRVYSFTVVQYWHLLLASFCSQSPLIHVWCALLSFLAGSQDRDGGSRDHRQRAPYRAGLDVCLSNCIAIYSTRSFFMMLCDSSTPRTFTPHSSTFRSRTHNTQCGT